MYYQKYQVVGVKMKKGAFDKMIWFVIAFVIGLIILVIIVSVLKRGQTTVVGTLGGNFLNPIINLING